MPKSAEGKTSTILVVDDDATIQRLIGKTLETYGYRIMLAGNGADAVLVFESKGHEIDLVLIDVIMPVMDGPETIRVLRKMKPAQRFLITSGQAIASEALSSIHLDAKNILTKPFTVKGLLSKVAEALG